MSAVYNIYFNYKEILSFFSIHTYIYIYNWYKFKKEYKKRLEEYGKESKSTFSLFQTNNGGTTSSFFL